VILAFYELSTGICYPESRLPPWRQYYARMNGIIQKLRDENSDETLILSDLVLDSCLYT
jgi:hypothetical protein